MAKSAANSNDAFILDKPYLKLSCNVLNPEVSTNRTNVVRICCLRAPRGDPVRAAVAS